MVTIMFRVIPTHTPRGYCAPSPAAMQILYGVPRNCGNQAMGMPVDLPGFGQRHLIKGYDRAIPGSRHDNVS